MPIEMSQMNVRQLSNDEELNFESDSQITGCLETNDGIKKNIFED